MRNWQAPEGAKEKPFQSSFAVPRLGSLFTIFPRLTPWTIVRRHSVAEEPPKF
jgi:hypothetical protein